VLGASDRTCKNVIAILWLSLHSSLTIFADASVSVEEVISHLENADDVGVGYASDAVSDD